MAYIVSDLRIPYWNIMWNGVQWRAAELGYGVKVYSAENIAKQELQNTVQAIREQVDGIVLSPTNSSAAVTVLKLAHKAQIPVVIADIGTQGGDYVSMIESDNQSGAYQLGKILVEELQARGWSDGRVGIIAIPQRRKNGKLRTSGFLQALEEGGIKTAELYQQEDFSYAETRGFARQLIADNPDLRALWLQGSDRYQGALDAIREAGKEGQILLICFDAEPEFIEMIQQRQLVGAGMQQPFLMGEQAVESLHLHLQGNPQPQRQKLEVLAVSADNIDSLLSLIRRNVLGQSESNH
ncbi:substrate-binding domain-containing protein [Neptuniibacter halophilus]|uniref:substrate-binding domain-containing protein n=1 Tax=Neptuniibacter halophilus TaxID=651666 RepID=UPI0025734EC9|nr:substrate-binding domain-containing protein [Neptuniibacter halophilus]